MNLVSQITAGTGMDLNSKTTPGNMSTALFLPKHTGGLMNQTEEALAVAFTLSMETPTTIYCRVIGSAITPSTPSVNIDVSK